MDINIDIKWNLQKTKISPPHKSAPMFLETKETRNGGPISRIEKERKTKTKKNIFHGGSGSSKNSSTSRIIVNLQLF